VAGAAIFALRKAHLTSEDDRLKAIYGALLGAPRASAGGG